MPECGIRGHMCDSVMLSVRLAAAQIRCNTKHGIPAVYTQRTCKRCGSGVDNEHLVPLLLECKYSALVEIRSGQRALFEGISDVGKLMAAAYKPELATILGSCMQGILRSILGLEPPIINTGF
jgi:hypothetical protein